MQFNIPTDHYQIPDLLEQTIENIETLPSIVSADNIYSTLANIFYLKEHGISARIPSRQQSKKINDKKNDNPYSIDYFIFDKIQNVYICPQKQILKPVGVYNAKVQKGGFHNKVILYSNYKACKNCPVKSKCTKSKHRTISRYVHPLLYEAEEIMDTPQGQKDYKLRGKTAESHNGTFIRVFNYDRLPIVGQRRVQGLMFRIVAAYNTIRLYNLIWDNHFDLGEVVDFIIEFSLANVEVE